jgi:receptor protein-tyrosine kinase
MSLIEQAAKRLEELRRAGALTDEESSLVVEDASGKDRQRVPTPEAAVRALDTRVHDAGAPLQRPPEDKRATAETTSSAPAARAARQRVEIDLERLKALGYVTPDAPQSQIADEFRVIKRPILRNARGTATARTRNGTLVMVTSALPGEGKTFTALNLAMSIAMEVDHSVLLVDGDVAHPTLPDLLGAPPSPGLMDLLTRSNVDLSDALVETNIDKLTILPAGSRHRRSTELLASEQMANLLTQLASRHPDSIVLFDSPPLLATTEARVLATNMGQIVMVVASDATTQHSVKHALAALESCEIVMMVLNKARKSDVGTYYAYYADEDLR